eukprot:3290563-Amphidinium_carterae.1
MRDLVVSPFFASLLAGSSCSRWHSIHPRRCPARTGSIRSERIPRSEYASFNYVFSVAHGLDTVTCDSAQSASQAGSCPAALPSSSFARSFKCVTFNVRSMNDIGKAKFVMERMTALAVDVAFIQESRLGAKFDFSVLDGFNIVSSPAVDGYGGLLILIKADKQLELLHYVEVSPRVLTATVAMGSLRLQLLCLHAPTAESSDADHELFAAKVKEALNIVKSDDLLFVGADLNARLGGLGDFGGLIGTQAVSECPLRASFRVSCLDLFRQHNLCAVNTVIAEPNDTTWRHPSGSEQQIDFVLAPQRLVRSGHLLSSRIGPWAYFDCGTSSDQRHIEATLLLESSSVPRSMRARAKRQARFCDDKHMAAFQAAAVQEIPCWNGVDDPARFITQSMENIAETVRSTAPKHGEVRNPWITALTWDKMFQLNKWRKLIVARKRGSVVLAERLYEQLGSPAIPISCSCLRGSSACTCATFDAINASIQNIISDLTKANRRLLRADRRNWFDARCSSAAEHEKQFRVFRPRELH